VPTVAKIGSLKIQVFADDHNPPHFHVVTPDEEALVRIDDLTILRGSLRARVFRTAADWARGNREVLVDEWNRLNS
jgi:hypothetical protein